MNFEWHCHSLRHLLRADLRRGWWRRFLGAVSTASADGATGAAGAASADGATGAAGAVSAVSADGATGAAGAVSTASADGATGAAGAVSAAAGQSQSHCLRQRFECACITG